MKKLLFILITIPLIFSSCEKEEDDDDNQSNDNTNTSIYGEWSLISFVNIWTPIDDTPLEYNHQFLPDEYCRVTFINNTSNENLIVTNGYYDNSFLFTTYEDYGNYSKTNSILYFQYQGLGLPQGVEGIDDSEGPYFINILNNNSLEFFIEETNEYGTLRNTWNFER